MKMLSVSIEQDISPVAVMLAIQETGGYASIMTNVKVPYILVI